MDAAERIAAPSTTPGDAAPRAVRLVRVAVLALAGLAIAFSATLHEQLAFDVAAAAVALGAIGAAHLAEWWALGSGRTPVPLLLAAVGALAAAALPAVSAAGGSVLGFAVVIAAWALASALLEFIGAAIRPGTRQDATLLGSIGILLALLVLLVREDQVAVLGFFGAYAVIAAVFLGISAFDTRPSAAPAAATAPGRQ